MTRFTALCFASSLAVLCWAALGQEPAEPDFDHEHKQLTSVLRAFVHDDRVDYAALAQDRASLDRYLARLSTQDAMGFAQWTKQEQFAFWLNAYNAFTLQAVLVNYPLQEVDSLRDVGGKASGKVWKQKSLRLGHLIPKHAGAQLSLEDLLELVLRPQFKDARVHAALCTSCLGSPALRPAAFTAAALDKELDAAARVWLADVRRTRFLPEQRRVEAPSVFDAYRQDFARDSGSVEAWITRFAPLDQRTWIEAAGGFERTTLDFDWKLNDALRSEVR